ncbi:MAG: hypothetical protein BWY89_01375 [Bacteroidetes bacterium ADurb.BinA012]|nr:MAG: hypothetical protein BWY89_01375 [Bacteroidetes bacterium ADurb.BinA012]
MVTIDTVIRSARNVGIIVWIAVVPVTKGNLKILACKLVICYKKDIGPDSGTGHRTRKGDNITNIGKCPVVTVNSNRSTGHGVVCTVDPLYPPGVDVGIIPLLGRHAVELRKVLETDVGAVAETDRVDHRIDMHMASVVIIIIPYRHYLFLR